jgi:hypothetical protein
MSKTQNSIEMSRPVACHQGLFHGSVFKASIVLAVLKTAAIRVSTDHFAHTAARASLAARMVMLGRPRACVRVFDCRQHQHIFTFNRDALESKAGERNVLAVAD